MKRYIQQLGLLASLLILISACTIINADKIPGKQIDKFNKKMLGTYELVLGEDFAGIMPEDQKVIIEIKSNSIVTTSPDQPGETAYLGDSLFYSVYEKQQFLSILGESSYQVFKINKSGKNLSLQAIYANSSASKEDLVPYFKSVETVTSTDEEGVESTSMFNVVLDESKIDAFLKSDFSYKDPFFLKRIK